MPSKPAMHVRIPRLVAAIACAASCACVTIPRTGAVHLAPTPDSSWTDEVNAATRRTQPYAHLTVREADLRATLITPRLRKAFLDHRSEFHGGFAREMAQDLVQMGSADEGVDAPAKSRPDAEEQVLVFVAIYATDQKERDLAARNSIWDTKLVRDGAAVKPIKIETLKLSPAVNEVFPFVDRFDEVYLLRFPLVDAQGHSFLTAGGAPLRLEIKSAEADAVVEWQLTD